MHLTWRQKDGWFDREYILVDDDENVVEELGEDPSLIELRNLEHQYNQRVDLWQTGLLCVACGNEINGRFGATPQGNLLCFDCAISSHEDHDSDLVANTDPAEVVLSKSDLYKKSLCDYVINVATGCKHGCEFCYVPTTPGLKGRKEKLQEFASVEDLQEEWGSYLLYRDDLPERLRTELEQKDQWERTERGRGIVMLSSGTDCYQDRRSAQITRACIRELVDHGRPVRVLTRSPAVLRDKELFQQAGDLVTVGSSIPTMNDELAKVLEPNAPPPSARWRALDEFRKAGVSRFVSMSPTYPTMGEQEIWKTLTYLKCLNPGVIFHEPINPRGKNFEMCVQAAQSSGMDELANELRKLKDPEKWVEYAIEQIVMVRQIADHLGGLNIHTWPDRELIKSTSSELRFKLSDMKNAVSPENIGEGVEREANTQPEMTDNLEEIKSNIR